MPVAAGRASNSAIDAWGKRRTLWPFTRNAVAMLPTAGAMVTSDWEKDLKARKEGRPRRRYYELTPAGKRQLKEAEARFMAVNRLFPKRTTV